MLWRKTFWLSECEFCRLLHAKRSWLRGYCLWSAWFALWWKRILFDLFETWSSSMGLHKGFRFLNFSGNPNLEEWIAAQTEAILTMENCDVTQLWFLLKQAIQCNFNSVFLRIMSVFGLERVVTFELAQQPCDCSVIVTLWSDKTMVSVLHANLIS